MITANHIELVGYISNFRKSHLTYGEQLYNFDLKCTRLSKKDDVIHCEVNKKDIHTSISTGSPIRITGEIRAYKRGRATIYKVFVLNMSYAHPSEVGDNVCKLIGTVDGDIYLDFNRIVDTSRFDLKVEDCRNSHNIPIVCWGQESRRTQYLIPGDKIAILGRLQQRKYPKNGEMKETFEVAVKEWSYER